MWRIREINGSTKAGQRADYSAIRAGITQFDRAARSAAISEHISRSGLYERAGVVLLYHPIGSEVDLRMLLYSHRSIGKRFLLPVTLPAGEMKVAEYIIGGGLKRAALGTFEPANAKYADPAEIDLALVPGVAFDLNGGRLGYGKGYYDRFLPKLRPQVMAVGICFFAQIADLPLTISRYDFRMNALATERGIITASEHGES